MYCKKLPFKYDAISSGKRFVHLIVNKPSYSFLYNFLQPIYFLILRLSLYAPWRNLENNAMSSLHLFVKEVGDNGGGGGGL
jgi:hypothetical protein